MKLDTEFIDLLKLLIHRPSVVGAEHSFFRVLQRELELRGANVTWYNGLLVAQGKKPDSAMFSAHIDRHGLICTGPKEYQYAAFISGERTDLLGNAVSEGLMNKITERFIDNNVYAYEPWSGVYKGKGTIKNSYICEHRNNLIFEIDGLNDEVVAGMPIAFEDSLNEIDGRLEAQLDNVLSAAALIHLFSLGFEGTVFFTAQEESGKSWRYITQWFRRFQKSTKNLYVVDTSPFPDTESADANDVVLRNADNNANFNRATATKIVEICKSLNISYVFKDSYIQEHNIEREKEGKKPRSLGTTELGRIINGSQGMVDGTTIQVPTTGYHTMKESASIKSVSAFITLLLTLSKRN